MPEEITSNKRIAKNTILLYGRMIVMTFIGLFTTRVILNALGVSDLGLMNVAGSVVGMFTFLNATMISGTQRFITYGIGEGNTEKLKKVFSSAMTLHLAIAVIITILCETVGLWYLYNYLNCEPERFDAAMWCYQLSVCSMFISMLQIPFNSALVAHEHMGMYAYMSIYDAVAKLLAAYLIMIVPFDRLIFYSTLSFIISLIPTFIYNWYCRKHFAECAFRFGFDKPIFKDMLSFSGWNTIGCMADMGQGTGINLVLNAFYGTVVNGARGIAMQANTWVYKFVDSFITAMRPQVTKSYAAGDYKRMADLVCNGSSYASYLYLFLGIPLFIEIEWVLDLWLGKCPEHTASFLRIIMIQLLLQTLGHLTVTAMHATGKMKTVNLTVGTILLTIVPIGYVLARLGYTSEYVLAACVIPWAIVPFVRIFLVNKYCNGNFPIRRYIVNSFLKTLFLAVVMFIPPYLLFLLTERMNDIIQFLIVGTTSVFTSFFVIYFFGLDKETRIKLIHKISEKLHIKMNFSKINSSNRHAKRTLLVTVLCASLGANVLFVSPYIIGKLKNDSSECFGVAATDREIISAVVNASLECDESQMIQTEYHGLPQDVKALFAEERNSDVSNNYYMSYNLAGLSQYALRFHDEHILQELKRKTDKWLNSDGTLTYELTRVDQCPIGIAYINLFRLTKENKYKEAANSIYLYLKGKRQDGNLIPYNSTDHTLTDAVGMYVPFLMEYYNLTKDTLARRIAIDNIEHNKKYATDADTHLPYHGYNLKTGVKIGSCNWGRGIGWYLLAIAYCPETNDSTLSKTVGELPYTQFPLSYSQFDSSVALLFELYKQSTNPKRKLSLDFIRTHIRKNGYVTDCSGDTYAPNDYSHSFGNNELCNGLLLLLYSKDFN